MRFVLCGQRVATRAVRRALVASAAVVPPRGGALRMSWRAQGGGPSPSSAAAALATPPAPSSESDPLSHITYDLVWGLWNDGNLFSLSAAELRHFLQAHCKVAAIDAHARKSALVRQVEEILSAAQANVTVPQEDQASSAGAAGAVSTLPAMNIVADYDRVEEALEEADEYGDWGAEPGFEARRTVDYMEVSPSRLSERYEPLVPRAYQLLHSNLSAEVKLTRIDPRRLPGQRECSEAYTATAVDAYAANRQRFDRAFKWCVANAWNMNIPAELNIGAGKALFYRTVAKQNRNVLPKWALQRHIYTQHPYVWFAIASESNVAAMEQLAARLKMRLVQEPTTSYRVTVRRMNENYDCDLNAQMQCIRFNRCWDRFFLSHYLRPAMPDLRFLVRGRHPVKKRIADAYLEAEIVRGSRDTVQSILPPELGTVAYCCERVIRKWEMRTAVGATLQLVETRRTPLIVTRIGDEGERLEYEWIVPLPQRAERLDIGKLSAELWDYGDTLARSLEAGMEDLMAHTMTAASLL